MGIDVLGVIAMAARRLVEVEDDLEQKGAYPAARLREAADAIAELIEATQGLIEISEMACGLGMFGREMPANANGPLPRAIAALKSVKGE